MTYLGMYTSLKFLYKSMMFPQQPHAPKWSLSEIDEMDVHFFSELMDSEEGPAPDKEVYLSDIWG